MVSIRICDLLFIYKIIIFVCDILSFRLSIINDDYFFSIFVWRIKYYEEGKFYSFVVWLISNQHSYVYYNIYFKYIYFFYLYWDYWFLRLLLLMQFIYTFFLWNISSGIFYPSMDEFNSSIHFANASQHVSPNMFLLLFFWLVPYPKKFILMNIDLARGIFIFSWLV